MDAQSSQLPETTGPMPMPSGILPRGLGLSANDYSVTAIYADSGGRYRRESGIWTQDRMIAYRALVNDWFTGATEATFRGAADGTGQNLH